MSGLLSRYAIGQALGIAALFFMPRESWLRAGWSVGLGWVAAFTMFAGVRRHRPQCPVAWYLFGAGACLATIGTMVEVVENKLLGGMVIPSMADIFWLAQYLPLTAGAAALLYRQSLANEVEPLVLGTAVCAVVTVVVGLFAWEFVVWREDADRSLSLGMRAVMTAYPLADLLVICFILRLFLVAGARSATLALLLAALFAFLTSDLTWMIMERKGMEASALTERLLTMLSMTGFALLGAAALHPSVRTLLPAPGGRRPTAIAWLTFAVSLATGPLVLLAQALIDGWYHLSAL